MSGMLVMLAGLVGLVVGVWLLVHSLWVRGSGSGPEPKDSGSRTVRAVVGACLVLAGLFGFVVGVGSARDLFANDDVGAILDSNEVGGADSSPFGSQGGSSGAYGSGQSSASSSTEQKTGDSATSESNVASDRWLYGGDDIGGPVTVPIEGSGDEDMTGEAQVREADLDLTCGDFDGASAELTDVMSRNGAVATSDETEQVGVSRPVGTYGGRTEVAKAMQRRVSMRVPVENLDALVQDLRDCELLEVESASLHAVDMTAARNENERRRAELQKLYDETKAALEASTDEDEKKSLEGKLESLEGRLKAFDEAAVDVDMSVRWSTVTAVLRESVEGDLAARYEFEQALGDVPRSFEVGMYRIGAFVLRNLGPILVVVGCVAGVLLYRRNTGRWPLVGGKDDKGKSDDDGEGGDE